MLVYIFGFLASLSMIYYAEKRQFLGTNAKVSVFFALLIPCLIAGLRHKTIGTDVQGYVENLFQTAESAGSFSDYFQSGYTQFGWDYMAVKDTEFGFALLTFLIQRIFGNMQVLLFVLQALTVIPVYKGLRAFEKTQPVWLGMAVYYLMFYNQTFNMMRQWIAMAVLFYAFQFLVNKSYRKYFVFVLIAWLFHASALFGIAIFAIYRLVASENKFGKAMKAFLICLIGVAALLGLDVVMRIMDMLGIKYGSYIDGTLTFMPNQIWYRLVLVLLLAVRWKYIKQTDRKVYFYLVAVVFDFLASQLTSIYAHSVRIGVYFSEYYMLVYPSICVATRHKNNKKLMQGIVLCFLCVYWFYVYVYGGTGQTVPYVSCFGA